MRVSRHSVILRMQTGATGEKMALSMSICMQLAVAFPSTSNPSSQVYIAVLPREFPLNVTSPLVGSMGSGHKAACARKSSTIIIITCW